MHIGNTGDAPQPGLDEWVSFEGQGRYYGNTLNVNGKKEIIISLLQNLYSHLLFQPVFQISYY